MMKPTKYYSSKQEKTIADYLEWSVVTASGARPFNPGDIKSSDYLCECKTHTSKQTRITIKKSVWKKISSEADSIFKKPVLFVDNGTQTIENTWCVIRKPKVLETVYVSLIGGIRDSDTQISFNHTDIDSLFKNNQNGCTEISIGGESLLLMKLETFKILLQNS